MSIARLINYLCIVVAACFGAWLGYVIGDAGLQSLEYVDDNNWFKYRMGIPLVGFVVCGLLGIIAGDILEKKLRNA